MKDKNKLREEIRETIELHLMEQDNQDRDDIGMMDEKGLCLAVAGITELFAKAKKEKWVKVGKNSNGEDVYENESGLRAKEKDHRYLVEEEK